ncbi:hypothetical protein MTP10_40365 [Nonomuraea sp. 3-1Str]|uniref:hypothetical protein n=1 Tax=Nonomuraea sp. 3-1Str TaxID=2929801 RepID=UPI002854AAF3|nr:hypothetical protein [Nonomuraea sp. 3-1Str]MDR8414972.1 hypothetical protein [Nonomuraea sp. 3-1Str]
MLEDRLREALDAKAEIYEPDPRAWTKVGDKAARRQRAHRFWTVALPAAAAVVIMGAVTLVGGLLRTDHAPPAGPAGEVVTDGDLKLWFGKATLSDGKTWDALCIRTPTTSRCQPYMPPKDASSVRRLLDLKGDPVISIGIAGHDVTSVAGIDGESDKKLAQGEVYTLKGAPAKIWVMRHAPSDRLQFEFRDTRGRRHTIGGDVDRCSPLPPEGAVAELGHGAGATLQEGCLIWWIDGEKVQWVEVGSPSDFAENVNLGRLAFMGYDKYWYGATRGGTARIEMVHHDGKRLSTVAKPDLWGLGIALFAVPADHAEVGDVVIGYDATGKEIWRDE